MKKLLVLISILPCFCFAQRGAPLPVPATEPVYVEYVHCGYNDSITDEIIQKIEAGQPTLFCKTIALGDQYANTFIIPKENCKKITVLAFVKDTTEIPLIFDMDCIFDCKNHEFKIINEALIRSGAVITISWFYRDCSG